MTKDTTQPDKKWKFDQAVTDCFDDMLQRSIPHYDVMRRCCFKLAQRFAKPQTAIVDLGCSQGEAMQELVDCFGAHNRFIGCDVSEPMLESCLKRFEGFIKCNVVSIRKTDLRTSYPAEMASVTLLILTLQFIPVEYRQAVLRKAFLHTVQGGALILVEKQLGNSDAIDSAMRDIYYDLKRENGYSQDSIDRKRLSLEGVLVPMTAQWNHDMLVTAGFRYVDCFWRWMNFAGWIAIKE